MGFIFHQAACIEAFYLTQFGFVCESLLGSKLSTKKATLCDSNHD